MGTYCATVFFSTDRTKSYLHFDSLSIFSQRNHLSYCYFNCSKCKKILDKAEINSFSLATLNLQPLYRATMDGNNHPCDGAQTLEVQTRRISNHHEAIESEISNDSSTTDDLLALVRDKDDDLRPQSIEQTNRCLNATRSTEEQVLLLQAEIDRLKTHNEQLMKLVHNVTEYKELLYFRSKISPVVEITYNFGSAPESVHWSNMMCNFERKLVNQHLQHNKKLDTITEFVVKLQDEVKSLKEEKQQAFTGNSIFCNVTSNKKQRNLK